MSEGATILLVEDEEPIRRFLSASLRGHGYRVAEASNGHDGLAEAAVRKPDMVLLDLGLPDMEGLDVIRELRTFTHSPILVLSARDQERMKVAALDAGADDYLTKPFGVQELLARIRVAWRHLARVRAGTGDGPARFECAGLAVDFETREVLRGEEVVHLTPLEFRLLEVLLANEGRVLTHRYLLREVWGEVYADQVHYLRVHMANLRKKLEANPARPRMLLTEQGVGYRFRVPPEGS